MVTAAGQRRWVSGTRTLRSTREEKTTRIFSPGEDGEEEEGRKKKRDATTGQHEKPLPYYALFPQTLPGGAPPDGPFDIDVRALRREFLQLQAASHPDLHHQAQTSTVSTSTSTDDSSSSSSPSASRTTTTTSSSSKSHSEPRRRAEALSSHINSAYRTLSSPLLRAQYVLAERHGVDLAGDEAARVSGPPDPALLMAVLEARETVEEARGEADLAGLSRENDERISGAVGRLGRALEAGDVPGAVAETVRLRYWENIRESIRNWEDGGGVVLQH